MKKRKQTAPTPEPIYRAVDKKRVQRELDYMERINSGVKRRNQGRDGIYGKKG
jgi:hypothetical protein